MSGVITTVAGDGSAGFSGDGGVATAAQLNGPHGVALDGAGDLFIPDLGNHCIRRVDAVSGVITTVAGIGFAGFSGDGGLATAAQLFLPLDVAVDGAGDLFIADFGNNCIRRVDAVSGIITTTAQFASPPALRSMARGTCSSPTPPATTLFGGSTRLAETRRSLRAMVTTASPATAAWRRRRSSPIPTALRSMARATCSSPTSSTSVSGESTR